LFGAAPLPGPEACAAEMPRAALARQRHLDDEPAWRRLHARKDLLDACVQRAAEVRAAHAPEYFVVLGIGGSALGNAAMTAALAPVLQEWRPADGAPRVFVLDNVDPDWLGEFFEAVPGDRVHFNVISKSGGTIETSAQFLLAWKLVRDAVGSDLEARTRFTITTDPAGGHFRALCDELGFATLPVPPGVGGRYSVLSPVGLFTAAMGGFDPASMLEGAAKTDARLRAAPADQDPALLYALAHVMHMRQGRNNHVHFVYSHRARLLAAWYQQLWAESLGKKRDRAGKLVHVGPTPLGAVGATDQHSQVQLYAEGPDDKVYTFLALNRFGRELAVPPPFSDSTAFAMLRGRRIEELMHAEREGTEIALAQVGRPWCRIELCQLDAFHLGAYFLFMEVATALAGELLGIDPFNQPGVEAGKRNALALMRAEGFEELGAELLAARAAAASWRVSC
ncbi:MAG: glucose-6-phosphate isomerase, partial [Planctomycetota bacterium]|nr:glucose-6-phosphate isomerase [Planctomycetota bacterium]